MEIAEGVILESRRYFHVLTPEHHLPLDGCFDLFKCFQLFLFRHIFLCQFPLFLFL